MEKGNSGKSLSGKRHQEEVAMNAKKCCLEESPVNQANDMEAAAEELRQQTMMICSVLEDAADELAKPKTLCCLVRRRTELEAAWASYEAAFYPLIQVADEEACSAASKVRRGLLDSSDEVLDHLATLIEAKAEEKASVVEVEDEICADKAEVVVVELLAKDDLEFCAIKDQVVEHCTAEVVAKESANKVEVEVFANKEVLFSSGQLDPGERDRQVTAKDELEQEFGAKKWVAANKALDAGEAGEVEMLSVSKVRMEEFASKVLCHGDLDPGEGAKGWKEVMKQLNVEVKREPSKVLGSRFPKLLGKFELHVPVMMRYVGRVPLTSSDYG